jgi:surface antigen
VLLALACGGCSVSTQLDSFFGDKAETTGSITPAPAGNQAGKLPPDGDLAYARAAVSAVLKLDKKDASQPWENPVSGARGTVTPLASAYTQDGQTCRNFLASFVNGSSEAWLQGEACKRDKAGAWQVRSLKPWTRS